MSRYEKVYVEGLDDKKALDAIFVIRGSFEDAGNKRKVYRKTEQGTSCCGIVDRDFDTDEDVRNSRGTDSNVAILQRYALENYLLEPPYLFQLAQKYNVTDHQDWESEAAIENLLIRKGQELAYYAAANELLNELKHEGVFQELTPFFNNEDPLLSPEDIRQTLQQRFEALPSKDDLANSLQQLAQRANEIETHCQTIQGVNRWINGKVLLRDTIYREIVNVNERFSKRSKKEFVLELANFARTNPPADLVQILRNFGILS